MTLFQRIERSPAGSSSSLRAAFEPHLGRELDDVRIHRGGLADASARQAHALAYTVGSSIVFRNGMFAPETPRGKRLLAHEIAHVAQQDAGGRAGKDAASSTVHRTPDEEPVEPTSDEVAGEDSQQPAGLEGGDAEKQGRSCAGVIRVHFSGTNFRDFPFNASGACRTVQVTLRGQWIGVGCAGGPSTYPVTVAGVTQQFPAGTTGVEEECPGRPPQSATRTFSVPTAGRFALRVSTGGQGAPGLLSLSSTGHARIS